MFDHSVYIAASYLAAAIVLSWVALAPVLKGRKLRAVLSREISRTEQESAE